MTARTITRGIAGALLLIAAAGCAPMLRDPGSNVGRAQAGDARRDAAQHCAGGGLRQRPGTDGTSPGHYVCTTG